MRLKIVSSCATILEGRWIKLLFVTIIALEFRYHRKLWPTTFADRLDLQQAPNRKFCIVLFIMKRDRNLELKNTRLYTDEVIVVDDGSEDNTHNLAKKAGAIALQEKY